LVHKITGSTLEELDSIQDRRPDAHVAHFTKRKLYNMVTASLHDRILGLFKITGPNKRLQRDQSIIRHQYWVTYKVSLLGLYSRNHPKFLKIPFELPVMT
jgi:hypothetical protein